MNITNIIYSIWHLPTFSFHNRGSEKPTEVLYMLLASVKHYVQSMHIPLQQITERYFVLNTYLTEKYLNTFLL